MLICNLDSTQMESYYLLARAFMKLDEYSPGHDQDILNEAYHCYQLTVYLEGRCSTVWMSIAVLYYKVQQYRDSIDALSRAFRLDLHQPLLWRNLGVVVSNILRNDH